MAPPRRGRRRQGRKRMTWRPRRKVTVRKYSPTYTEIVAAGNIQANNGGQFVCRFVDIPQQAQYSSLYKQFCIKKLSVMLLPRLNSFDANTALAVGTSYWAPRLTYSVDDTPSTTIPGSELDVLSDNGAKVVSLTNKRTLTCYPKPSIGSIDTQLGSVVATRMRKAVWLNTNSADVANSGVNVQHHGIRYWLTGNPLYNDFMFDVYYKITFQLRDPA